MGAPGGPAGIALALEGVRYRYGEAGPWVLSDIDLRIAPGEFIAVVGANGSGKSTLALLLDGLLLPTAGRVRVDGLDTADTAMRWAIRRRVGVVFQNPDNQFVAPAVEDDVAFGPENLGLPPSEIGRRVTAALAMVGMEAYRGADPHALSGGQRQRVAIAGALAMDPPCLCLDEVTSLLDPVGRREVRAAVADVRRSGRTIVWITHDMEEAAGADRVVVLSGGRVLGVRPPAAVFDDAALLASAHLEPPVAVVLSDRLRRSGLALPAGIIERGELVAALAQMLPGR